ncbi:hypothetical protein M430DRAFT_190852 [Amorphotheca resinae ATCC 22711]|uniref:Uncharacterized protein n=1 Tax=Amorphotheca resinae ATCC 22711 TaxID=857342 RepID=A0A2T3APQ5_AMORE|nr:hypothetical protein M430DRAFT_190852 [Amorphotheca resinae ATCC 22711]PSS06954.1 hypothetical protein M430DRAFT_190852 [Amorphotheca resinae ATCC 22711]
MAFELLGGGIWLGKKMMKGWEERREKRRKQEQSERERGRKERERLIMNEGEEGEEGEEDGEEGGEEGDGEEVKAEEKGDGDGEDGGEDGGDGGDGDGEGDGDGKAEEESTTEEKAEENGEEASTESSTHEDPPSAEPSSQDSSPSLHPRTAELPDPTLPPPWKKHPHGSRKPQNWRYLWPRPKKYTCPPHARHHRGCKYLEMPTIYDPEIEGLPDWMRYKGKEGRLGSAMDLKVEEVKKNECD